MRFILFFCILLILLFTSCGSKNDQQSVDERFQFVKDTLPDLELTTKRLKPDTGEVVTYELSILNHTSRSRTFYFLESMDIGIHCEGGSIVRNERGIVCNAMMSFCKCVPAHNCLKHTVELHKESIRNPKFYWRLIEVEGISKKPVVLDTIELVTH